MTASFDSLLERFRSDQVLTLGELVETAEEADISLSRTVVAEAMVREKKSYEEVLEQTVSAFAPRTSAAPSWWATWRPI